MFLSISAIINAWANNDTYSLQLYMFKCNKYVFLFRMLEEMIHVDGDDDDYDDDDHDFPNWQK